eukprot:Skav224965  [mRNA]  locus=scaffold3893:17080:25909:+ [translate_table: standard]
MGTPIKSPAQKKMKAYGEKEEMGNSDDVQILDVRSSGDQQSPNDVTLQAIANLLDQKLDPVHKLARELRDDLSKFKASVRAEFQSMGLRVSTMEGQNAETCSKIAELEKEVANIRISISTSSTAPAAKANPIDLHSNIVVGNIPGEATFESAKEWLTKHCQSYRIEPPAEIYTKGPYAGLIFAKCVSPTQRDSILSSIRTLHTSASSAPKTWAKVDKPLNARTVESTLMAMKRMLIEWEYPRSIIDIDLDAYTLSVGRKEIVKVSVDNFSLQLKWVDGETGQMLQDFGAKWYRPQLPNTSKRSALVHMTGLLKPFIEQVLAAEACVNWQWLRLNSVQGLWKAPIELVAEAQQLQGVTGGNNAGKFLLSVRLAETTLPVRTPKFYYGDISNETTNYILITERVPFVGAGGRTSVSCCVVESLLGSLQAMQSKLRIAIQFFSQTAAHFFPSYAVKNESRSWSWECTLQELLQLSLGLSVPALRFIEKFSDVLMKYSAYMFELECWKHEDLDVESQSIFLI